jgi:hypothetical protein
MSILSQYVERGCLGDYDFHIPTRYSNQNFRENKDKTDQEANYVYVTKLLNGKKYFKIYSDIKDLNVKRVVEIRQLPNGFYECSFYTPAQPTPDFYYERRYAIEEWMISDKGWWEGRDEQLKMYFDIQWLFHMNHLKHTVEILEERDYEFDFPHIWRYPCLSWGWRYGRPCSIWRPYRWLTGYFR